MDKYHNIRNINFIGNHMCIEIDGKAYVYPLDDISASLAKASYAERMIYEISPSGYGIHWPLLDEDISIDGMLDIVHMPEQERLIA